MANERTVLITGATGKQGGATARALAGKGFQLRAMTRKPESDAAKAVASATAPSWCAAISNDAASLKAGAAGAWGVFAVQNTWEAGVAGEEEQGKRLATLARDAGVQHFVYTSVDRRTARRASRISTTSTAWKTRFADSAFRRTSSSGRCSSWRT